MHKQRLLKLADLLEADAKNKKGIKFDLRLTAKLKTGEIPSDGDKVLLNCNTTACAIGLWGLSGQFRGVSWKKFYDELRPTYQGRNGIDAAELYFDLSEHESEWLFLDDYYPVATGKKGELAVAARIRDFVAGKYGP